MIKENYDDIWNFMNIYTTKVKNVYKPTIIVKISGLPNFWMISGDILRTHNHLKVKLNRIAPAKIYLWL